MVLLDYFKIVSSTGFKVQTHPVLGFLVHLIIRLESRVHVPKPSICVSQLLLQMSLPALGLLSLFLWLPYPGLLLLLVLPFRLPLPAVTALPRYCQTNSPSRIWLLWPICCKLYPSSICLGILKHLSEDLGLMLSPTKRFCSCCNPLPSLISVQILYTKSSSSTIYRKMMGLMWSNLVWVSFIEMHVCVFYQSLMRLPAEVAHIWSYTCWKACVFLYTF